MSDNVLDYMNAPPCAIPDIDSTFIVSLLLFNTYSFFHFCSTLGHVSFCFQPPHSISLFILLMK